MARRCAPQDVRALRLRQQQEIGEGLAFLALFFPHEQHLHSLVYVTVFEGRKKPKILAA
jgi:hypothetical protein